MRARDIPMPERWPNLIRQAMLHAVSLAHFSIICAWGRTENSTAYAANFKGRIDRLQTQVARLKDQNRILMARFGRIPANKRTYYTPIERMEILSHKAACGWNSKQTAEAFMTDEGTIASWLKRIDDDTLIKVPVPWNKYPEYLKHITQQLKILVPRMGKKKISEYFVRSGLYLAANTVKRYLKSETAMPPLKPDNIENEDKPAERIVTSKHPDHVWSIDLTIVPTSGGFWTSWLPNSLHQRWPFCWWVFVIVDHFSRKAIGFALFKKQPTSEDITAALDNAIAKNGRKPKHIISDKGSQFYCENYKNWCVERTLSARFGAVGKHGSIAITERFIKSMKVENTRCINVPLNLSEMRHELALYFMWYNQHRPHEYLLSRTPLEVYNYAPKKEPPLKLIHSYKVPQMELQLSFLDGRKHLPVIELKKAA